MVSKQVIKNYDKVLEKSADCTKKITEAKNDYINKMTDKHPRSFSYS